MKTITVSLLAFISTNVDDFFLLTLWFLKRATLRVVVLGQFVGFTALLLASVGGYIGTTLLPPQSVHWLGLLPIAIGIKQLWSRHTEENLPADSWRTVATLTALHGGDNIAVYVPLFARYDSRNVALSIACFYAALALLVGIARIATRKLSRNERFHKMANQLSPFVIMFIGGVILVS
jgi:cadmium resistance protein CadD (predicted permease)